jgi:hypothetical protein
MLEAAMAAEIAMRTYLTATAADPRAARRIERARIPELLEMLSAALPEPNRTSFAGLKDAFRHLSQRRNTLMHTGVFVATAEECVRSCEIVQKLLLLT